MHLLYGAIPVPYMPVRVARGAQVALRYTYAHLAAEPRCIAGLLFPYKCPRTWSVSRAGLMLFCWPKLLEPFLSSTVLPFLFFLSIGSLGWYCGAGVFRLIWC